MTYDEARAVARNPQEHPLRDIQRAVDVLLDAVRAYQRLCGDGSYQNSAVL